MRCLFSILLLITTPVLAQLNADFSSVTTQGCAALTVQFKDNSTGSPTSWFWDFGNGVTSALQDPKITYTESGNYTVRLVIKNAAEQDYEEKTNFIKVFETPQADFITNIDSGCFPLQVSFTDMTNLSKATIQSWVWNFGDGSTSSQQNPVHIFTTEAQFDVSLTIQTTDGCVNTVQRNGIIQTGAKPTADFKASPLDGCASSLRLFDNKSLGKITSSFWNFGDSSISNEEFPEHHFLDTGWFSVKLVVARNGCKDSIRKVNYIHVNGPVAIINKNINCSDRLTPNFRNISIGDTTAEWDFGDGVSVIGQKNIDHTYSGPGRYTIQLRVSDGICSDTAKDGVYISAIKPVAVIQPKRNFYCRGDSIQFLFTIYDTASASSFAWNFGNGDSLNYTFKNDTVTYVYNGNGNFKPLAFFKDQDRCIDTLPLNTVNILGATAAFTSSSPVCVNSMVTFTDQSVADGAPITKWVWNYGDGTRANDTKPFTYTYAFDGTVNVTLTTTDANGCKDSVTNAITISKSPVVTAGADTSVCSGTAITLTASGAGQFSWQSNGNVICNNCTNPVISPSSSATYYVRETDASGCFAVDSMLVKVQAKKSISVQPSDAAVCLGDSVQLIASGSDFYSWSPAAGLSNTSVSNPFAHPSVSSVYMVVGKDSSACFSDTTSVNMNVLQAPSVIFANDMVQLPAGSDYSMQPIASPDVQTWQWLPANGLSCYNCQNPIATVTNTTTYSATVTNANGCSSSDSITLVVLCNNTLVFLPNTFTPNNDGMNDYFFPNSPNALTIQFLKIYNRWGQLIFENTNFPTNNFSSGWNGKYKNQDQTPDVYVYMMQFTCAGGATVLKKGNITLLR